MYYKDGAFTFQIFFYSLNTNAWIPLPQEQELQVVDGQAVLDLGVNASSGYLYLRPVTKPESNFIELYVE